MCKDVIYAIDGCIVKVKETTSFSMLEKVFVGKQRLMGEVIAMNRQETLIQVYESTSGLQVGEEVIGTNEEVALSLGPGMLANIFDGIQRPLKTLQAQDGSFLKAGSDVEALNQEVTYDIQVQVKVNDDVKAGDIYLTCQETPLITHKCMIPSGLEGTVVKVVENGSYHVNDEIIVVEDMYGIQHSLTMVQKWPIKTARPILNRKENTIPLLTGQRIFDSVFPIAKGGSAAIPGGFGTGKTMTQHQIAKYCDADIIVYIGCGERGNEMCQVLEEFSELIDPKTGRPLLERTVLIANTSNMPVAAREASIYTGLTIAEYYRDMGYHTAIMADSTSRWAEALREISARLEEMPAEEGFPAYLPSRIASFYERAGYVENLNGTEGSVSIIGAVSPQGSDFSEPVTQNTKRFVRCFWALDKALAYARHYFAINWNESYSEYIRDLTPWYEQNANDNFMEERKQILAILQEENELNEIVKLIGADVLPDSQKLVLEIARVIRVGFLQQNAFHQEDCYVPLSKQYKMMHVILKAYDLCQQAISKGMLLRHIQESGIFEKLLKMKYEIKNDQDEVLDTYPDLFEKMLQQVGGRR